MQLQIALFPLINQNATWVSSNSFMSIAHISLNRFGPWRVRSLVKPHLRRNESYFGFSQSSCIYQKRIFFDWRVLYEACFLAFHQNYLRQYVNIIRELFNWSVVSVSSQKIPTTYLNDSYLLWLVSCWHDAVHHVSSSPFILRPPPRGGVLPYMGFIDMCGPKGEGINLSWFWQV